MKATFLGHGLDTKNKFNVGKQLAISFESNQYDSFNGFVAFAAISGVQTILPQLRKAKSKFNNLKFFVGVDNKGTSKEALEKLLSENIETYIYHDKHENITYHPKLFVFEGAKQTRVIIGSSNLTSSGIKSNIEASIQLDFRTKTDKQGNKLLNEIKDYYSDLINLKSINLKKLSTELIDELDKENLLYKQFVKGNRIKESISKDGSENEKFIDVTDFDINTGIIQSDTRSRSKNSHFSASDYERFDFFFDQYIKYKKDERSSGVVSKHTENRELFYWYRKMNDLARLNELPPEILEKLQKVDFPFGKGAEKTRLMRWDEKFKKLIEYKNKVTPKSKVTHVPHFKDKTNPYYHLGIWCAEQKQRRKGNYSPVWTEHEEKKMNSINFLWEVPNSGSIPKDDEWADILAELEDYYNDSKNYKTVPSQKTKLGKWLNEQITLKLWGSRGRIKKYLDPIREEMLGDLLKKNGIEWEWEKQKHRESVEETLKCWQKVTVIENLRLTKKLTEKEMGELKICREKVATLKYRSKKWHNNKNMWKLEILDSVGFPYPKENM